ncbi:MULTISPECIES: adaptor protein MecA [unclassified Granulicatella]|uniref:adaptor protein MecA n=1 Tax=unclassified Granulicatella TaxID=2630493 RepID=UPI001073B40A|nr:MULTISPECIES: adaptor protein MecA [unclassified Granulicatella]MBF0779992.1 adaptor protein MecA [Granulicatella sp. 19428wC4_WM01]TFU95918.1 adaptor protein MecA [Granulicatella sp. WM01]
MELEHINENTIKVIIASSDLEERGITFFDLLGSQKKVESFFYSILEEVGVRHEFEGIDAVTFQVVPKTDGLDLYITKGMVDNFKDYVKSSVTEKADADTPLDQIIQEIENAVDKDKKGEATREVPLPKKRPSVFQVFVFDELSHYITFSKSLPSSDIGLNRLYFYKGKYFWSHKTEARPAREYIYYQAIEHAEPAHLSDAFLYEHAHHIMESDAISITRKYFN